jgi:hypothetical protein
MREIETGGLNFSADNTSASIESYPENDLIYLMP